ncbi:CotS family spore coat protein [Litchfieldia salsa]|uniref:Spore coat protein, CotS family n=1 Tax=Litchfieldia salsa TaxID=930152 RepID=A0A1H0QCH1_9BACI|nr:CotS family spore coat protein [Litchfieldia salsa]SDP15073.1 spore coat protein, CotS family [Litchfieldia salsa]
MEKQRIDPWGDYESIDDLYIPDYVSELAQQALQHYDFVVSDITVMATKPFKGGAIWKIETNLGPKSLKLLHRRPSRSIFSLGAQNYLVETQGARVPSIVKTKDGRDFVEIANKIWFVAEWIVPLEPTSSDLEGAKNLCRALGEFHRLTKGYVPPKQAEVPSRVKKWPRKYEKVITKLEWFRHIVLAYPEMPASELINHVLDYFKQQAETSLKMLQESSYHQLAQKGDIYWGLAHQDYGWSNAQMGIEGMWVIDLDGVTYDLPMRDLSKLIASTMSDINEWDATFIREMVKAYHETNPITPEMYEVLWIDLSFPDAFYKEIKSMVYEPELFLNEDTKQSVISVLELEDSKWTALSEIKEDWKGVNITNESLNDLY